MTATRKLISLRIFGVVDAYIKNVSSDRCCVSLRHL